MEVTLRLAHLYPKLMNLYGDRGNILCLRRRCQQRGITLIVDELTLGDRLDPAAYDLIFIGGAQDREQQRVATDLLDTKAEALHQAVADGVALLAVCGGYQLLGRYYRPAAGPDLPGVGIFDARTVHPGPSAKRFIGNVVVRWQGGTLVGFENHGGRTYLGPNARPLATVIAGFGNNGRDGGEGAVRGENAFGTYLHGSLLPKNPRFADHLIALAVRRRHGEVELAPLDDDLEERAHAAAVRLATNRFALWRR
ncbi:MAG: type 1 glutamine amidotransferase [Dehalococcoidia bacterium]